MDNAIRNFEKRHKSITRKHQRLARGYVTKLGKNGLIEHQPMRHLPRLSFGTLFLFVAGFVGFKTLLLLKLGEDDYITRVDTLGQGGGIERFGAWLMQIDPLTVWSLTNVAPIFG